MDLDERRTVLDVVVARKGRDARTENIFDLRLVEPVVSDGLD